MEYTSNILEIGQSIRLEDAIYVDKITDRVGIGTTSPAALLQLEGASANLKIKNTTASLVNITQIDLTGSVVGSGAGNERSILFGVEATPARQAKIAYGQNSSNGQLPFLAFLTGDNVSTLTERMRITSGGNVGIGTVSPAARLHSSVSYTAPTGGIDANVQIIASNTSGASVINMLASNASTSAIHFGDTDDANVGEIAYTHGNNRMLFVTNASINAVLTSGGNLLLGTTTDNGTDRLQVSGSGRFSSSLQSGTLSNGNIKLTPTTDKPNIEINGGSGSASAAQSAHIRLGDVTNSKYVMQQINNNGDLDFWMFNGSAWSNRAVLTNGGNLGLGVTPSAWVSTAKALQIGTSGALSFVAGANVTLSNNQYFNGTNDIYIQTAAALMYRQATNGQHQWFTAPYGTAGTAITFTQAMTLAATGNLLLGTTTDDTISKLQVNGRVSVTTGIQYNVLIPTTSTTTSTATLNIDLPGTGDTYTITSQQVALAVNAPTGTFSNGQKLMIRIKDNGTARAITWTTGTSGSYRASSDLALPTTTIANRTMYLGFIWNSTDSRWDLIAFLNNFT